jgi:phosphomethylpyrimidine synthase
MKITEDVRQYAAQQKISGEAALQVGIEPKAKEFVEKGGEVTSMTSVLFTNRMERMG